MITTCISLIGMAGVGKSTIGHLLAQKLNKDFVDTDALIEHKHQQKLQQLLDSHGYLKLRELEAECICTLTASNSIIATGGSAVYSATAINHLKTLGPVIFLDAKLSTITARVTNFASRGLACKPGQTLDDLFNERYPLYLASGDIHITCDNKSISEICEEILIIYIKFSDAKVSIKYIKAKKNDGDELAEIRAMAMRPSLTAIGRFDEKRVRSRFLDAFEPDNTYKIIKNDEILGFYAFTEKENHYYISHLYIKPSYQNMGLGLKVIKKIIEKTKFNNFPIRLGALRDSRSNDFYTKNGFIKTHEDEFDIYYEYLSGNIQD